MSIRLFIHHMTIHHFIQGIFLIPQNTMNNKSLCFVVPSICFAHEYSSFTAASSSTCQLECKGPFTQNFGIKTAVTEKKKRRFIPHTDLYLYICIYSPGDRDQLVMRSSWIVGLWLNYWSHLPQTR